MLSPLGWSSLITLYHPTLSLPRVSVLSITWIVWNLVRFLFSSALSVFGLWEFAKLGKGSTQDASRASSLVATISLACNLCLYPTSSATVSTKLDHPFVEHITSYNTKAACAVFPDFKYF